MVDKLMVGWVDMGEVVSYSSGELVCLWPREVTGIFMFIAV